MYRCSSTCSTGSANDRPRRRKNPGRKKPLRPNPRPKPGRAPEMSRLCLILLVISLAGCTFGPDYQRPETSMPESFRYEEKEAQDTANTDWWKSFNDPVLDSLIVE